MENRQIVIKEREIYLKKYNCNPQKSISCFYGCERVGQIDFSVLKQFIMKVNVAMLKAFRLAPTIFRQC